MTYVLDSNVGLKWVLNESDSAQARALLADFRNSAKRFIAPDSFCLEAAHALTKAQRRGMVNDAEQLWLELMLDRPDLMPTLPLIRRALIIANDARIGVYDCLYVALAEQENCKMLTADTRLINALQSTFPFIVHFAFT